MSSLSDSWTDGNKLGGKEADHCCNPSRPGLWGRRWISLTNRGRCFVRFRYLSVIPQTVFKLLSHSSQTECHSFCGLWNLEFCKPELYIHNMGRMDIVEQVYTSNITFSCPGISIEDPSVYSILPKYLQYDFHIQQNTHFLIKAMNWIICLNILLNWCLN